MLKSIGPEPRSILVAVSVVTLANLTFHHLALSSGDVTLANRIGVSAYVLLIMLIGSRIIPSFTRNWFNKAGSTQFPTPFNRYDGLCIIVGAAACIAWVATPVSTFTAILAIITAILHSIGLYRWRG